MQQNMFILLNFYTEFAAREQDYGEEAKAQFDDGNSTDLYQGGFDDQGTESNEGNEDSTETPIRGFGTSDYSSDAMPGQMTEQFSDDQDEFQEPQAKQPYPEEPARQHYKQDEVKQENEETPSHAELQGEQRFDEPASREIPEGDSSQRNQQEESGKSGQVFKWQCINTSAVPLN